jgi:Zn-dependent protease with chaperone function
MTIVIALAAFAGCWLVLCPLAAAVHRLANPSLYSLQPQPRAALLLALALLPLTVAMLVAVLGFAPAIGGWVVDEHCHPTTGCTTHVPVVRADALYATALVLIAALGSGALLWSIARRLRRSLRIASSLRFLAEQSGRQPFELIESHEPFAYCIGLLRPKVVLSRGIIDRLSPLQLEVVLRHEQAHAARLDNLRLWLAGLSLLPLPLRLKQPLLAALALAGEQACDRAAVTVDGPALVIETLSALAGGARPNGRRALTTFDSPMTIVNRMDALRREPRRQIPGLAVRIAIAIAYTTCAILATDLVHHGTERLLAAIT